MDWNVLYKNAREKMASAEDVKEYYTILREMISAVHDGHVNVSLTEDKISRAFYLPVKFKEVEGGKIVISAIKESGFIDSTPVELGDEVLAINGTPIEGVIENWEHFLSGSTKNMRRFIAIMVMNSWLPYDDPPARNSILTIVSGNTTREVEIPWIIYDPQDDPTYKDEEYRIGDDVAARILPGNIGYLRVSAMWSPVEEKYIPYITSQMEKLLNTDGLIIDIRSNGGGSGFVGDAIVSYLIDKPTIGYKASPRMSLPMLYNRPEFYSNFEPDPATDYTFAKWDNVVIEPVDEGMRYKGKVITLIDSGCFSACDTFADSLASNGLSTMMGEPTGGGTGYPIYITLPSYIARVRFSTTRGFSNFGRQLEGFGTIPDVPAKLSADDIKNRRDSVLIRAHEILRNKNGSGAAKLKNSASSDESDNDDPKLFQIGRERILPHYLEEQRLINLSGHEFDTQ